MGTDISNHSGVLVSADSLVNNLITSKRKIKKLKAKLSKVGLGKVFIINEDDEPEHVRGVITQYISEQVLSDNDRYSDAEIEDEQIVEDILQCIVDTCSTKKLPPIQYLQVFGNYRLTDAYGCELDTVYVVFDEDDCFIKLPSEAGGNLQKLTSHIEVTTWSSISY